MIAREFQFPSNRVDPAKRLGPRVADQGPLQPHRKRCLSRLCATGPHAVWDSRRLRMLSTLRADVASGRSALVSASATAVRTSPLAAQLKSPSEKPDQERSGNQHRHLHGPCCKADDVKPVIIRIPPLRQKPPSDCRHGDESDLNQK